MPILGDPPTARRGTAAGNGTALNRAFQAVAQVIVPELADACLILTLTRPEWLLSGPEVPVEARTARRLATAARPGLLDRLQDLSDHRDDTALVAFRADAPPT